MNQAHFHLMIVHIPIITVPFALILFTIGHRWESRSIKLVALNTFIVGAVFAGLAFLLGEGAEEMVENIAGIAESTIESHEDSAVLALWLTVALGLVSLTNLSLLKYNHEFSRYFFIPIIALGVLSSGALAYTSKEAGKIRHPEAYNLKFSGVAIEAEDG